MAAGRNRRAPQFTHIHTQRHTRRGRLATMKGRLRDAAKGKSNRPPWLREKELMAVSSWLILRPSRKQMANGLDWHLYTDDHQQHQQSMRASTSLRCFPNGSPSGGSTKLSAKTKSMFRLLLRWSLIRLVCCSV